jgi:hypothetical protein
MVNSDVSDRIKALTPTRKLAEIGVAILVFGSAIGIIYASRADPLVLVLIITLYFGGYGVGLLDEPGER